MAAQEKGRRMIGWLILGWLTLALSVNVYWYRRAVVEDNRFSWRAIYHLLLAWGLPLLPVPVGMVVAFKLANRHVMKAEKLSDREARIAAKERELGL